MKYVWVYSYNTADKPERRILGGARSTFESAKAAIEEVRKIHGDFVVDTEIQELLVQP